MRQFPAASTSIVKISALLIGVFLLAPGPAARADGEVPEVEAVGAEAAEPVARQAIDRSSYMQGLQAAMGFSSGADKPAVKAPPEKIDLGSLTDPNSAAYKSDRLARKARQQREKDAFLDKKDDVAGPQPPPEVETLQMVNESMGGTGASLSDNPVDKGVSLDLRKDAQKEAALSYGARGGLAKHNYEIMERMKDFDPVLDKVFNFRSLLIQAPSGLLIEPPIVKESLDALVITEGGNEAAVASEVFDINKKAKIVSAPRDWRQYLLQTWSDVPPPPRILWPKNAKEQADWNGWVVTGWKAGFEQAEQIFELNTNRLVADYSGMVRYKTLLAQNMFSQPYAMHEDRGVTADKNQMRVGDRALRITGPSQFLTGTELWKPADR